MLVCETNGTDTIWYTYDESGNPIGMELNGTQYYYMKNVQGDVIAILDANGNKVVEYDYNAWGYLRSTTGILASTVGVKNPIRYRGYYYDVETGLYYLQSRYYDPQTGRFINADDTDYLGADGSFASYNLFAYCNNNPVNNSDPSGCVCGSVIVFYYFAIFIVGICAIIASAIILTDPGVQRALNNIISLFGSGVTYLCESIANSVDKALAKAKTATKKINMRFII